MKVKLQKETQALYLITDYFTISPLKNTSCHSYQAVTAEAEESFVENQTA